MLSASVNRGVRPFIDLHEEHTMEATYEIYRYDPIEEPELLATVTGTPPEVASEMHRLELAHDCTVQPRCVSRRAVEAADADHVPERSH